MFKLLFKTIFWLGVYAACGYAAYTYWYVPKFAFTASKAAPAEPPAQNVRAATAQRGDYVLSRDLQARVVARRLRALNFAEPGCIQDVFVSLDIGTLLEPGVKIARLDDTALRLNVAETQARESEFEASVAQAEIELKIAERAQQRTSDSYEQEQQVYDRQQALFERQLLTQNAFDSVEKAFRAARDRRDQAADEKTRAQANLRRLLSERDVLTARLNSARFSLSRLELTAPTRLRVLENQVHKGTCVTATQPVIKAYEVDSVEIVAELPRLLIDRMDGDGGLIGSDITLQLPASQCGSRVVALDDMDAQSDKISLRIALPPDCEDAPRYGDTLVVSLPIQTLTGVFRLPRAAERAPGTVFKITDGKLSQQPVFFAARDEDWIYVESGLSQGDAILISETGLALDGLRVRVVQP